ncbi:hypothetical protein BG000_008524 [Podila horticola]|nr:hypothetical protein BG000_008524 [Podila horticola]
MGTSTPFNIPEILHRITSFVPVWKEDECCRIKFYPRPLLFCSLVSKSWRDAALPHLWRVYSAEHMAMVPIHVLADNSPHFRYFDLKKQYGDEPRLIPKELWKRDTSGQPLLRCAALKSIGVTPNPPPEHLELLRVNRNLASLDWWSLNPSELPGTIDAIVAPFAASLKNLSLVEGSFTVQSLLSLLACFPNLEHFHMGASHKPLFRSRVSVLKGSAGVRILPLKHLKIIENVGKREGLRALLSMFRHCPQIKHVVVNGHTSNFNNHGRTFAPLVPIHKMVLAWRVQHLAASAALASEESTSSSTPEAGHQSSQESSHGVDKLDVHLSANESSKTWIDAFFENGCRDLVRFSAEIRFFYPGVMLPWLLSYNNTLREVYIGYGSTLGDDFEAFTPFLRSLPELRRFGFSTRDGLTREKTIALFRGQYDQETGLIMGATESSSSTTADWVCSHLESLAIDGMWGVSDDEFYGEDEGQSDGLKTAVLPAASEDHKWVAKEEVAFDRKLKKAVVKRIKALPALRELTLNYVSFAFTKRP